MAEQIPLFRVAMNYPKVIRNLEEVLTPDANGGTYIGQGARVEEFERAFGQLTGAPMPPLALNSCTSALELALHLAGVRRDSEVITTPLTCTATTGAIARTGATIVWADCDPLTGLIDPKDVGRKVTRDTAAIVAVDWGGRRCDYAELAMNNFRPTDGAAYQRVPIIQDAAHGVLTGQGGHYTAYSFQAIKHLTTGDGGALLAPPDQMERGRLLRWYGLDRRSEQDYRCRQNIQEVGFKMHMNDIAASIGLANLEIVESVVARHRDNAAWYGCALRGAPGITVPPPDPGSSWWLYTLSVEADRDGFIRHMAERGIATSLVHGINTKHDAFRAISRGADSIPHAEYFDQHQVSIPVGWWVTEQDRERIAEAVLIWSRTAKRKEFAHA